MRLLATAALMCMSCAVALGQRGNWRRSNLMRVVIEKKFSPRIFGVPHSRSAAL